MAVSVTGVVVWEGHFRPFGWLHKMRFDQTLMDAYRSPVPQLAMAQVALGFRVEWQGTEGKEKCD
eukprot:9007793-Pyramimonas_sp.AAC.1